MAEGDDQNSAEANPEGLAESALTNQGDLDKLIATGRLDVAPMAALRQMTGWDGLTEKEEEDARLLNSQQQALAEYERTMDEVRQRADRLMAQLDEQEREGRKKLAEADARAIILHDGSRVLVGDKDGEYIDEASGRALEGADKTEAEKLRKPDSETAAEHKELEHRLEEIKEAKDHVRNAATPASQDDENLTQDEQRQKVAQAKEELAKAAAMSKDIDAKEAHLEDSSNAAALGDTDTLAVLGLSSSQTGRTTSYAASLEEQDGRATVLQSQFTASAQAHAAAPPASMATSPGMTDREKISTSAPTQK